MNIIWYKRSIMFRLKIKDARRNFLLTNSGNSIVEKIEIPCSLSSRQNFHCLREVSWRNLRDSATSNLFERIQATAGTNATSSGLRVSRPRAPVEDVEARAAEFA